MKVKKVMRISSKPIAKSTTKKKKKDLSKVTTKEFFDYDFENSTDSDDKDDDRRESIGKMQYIYFFDI